MRSVGEGEGALLQAGGLSMAWRRHRDGWERVFRGRKSQEESHGSEKRQGRNKKTQVVYTG